MRVTRVTEEPRGRIQAQTETGGQRELGADEHVVEQADHLFIFFILQHPCHIFRGR
ncbi:hypothetical protein KXW23_001132, partial [Aspergillus fumigatus]